VLNVDVYLLSISYAYAVRMKPLR